MYTAQAEISQSQKPTTAPPVLENIPSELKERPCWVAWEYRFRNGKWTKMPFGPKTGNFAKSNDPRTWATFEQAVEYYTTYSIHEGRGSIEGVGFMLTSPYCGCDLDKCIHGEGEIEPWARNYIDRLASYTEVSPSGTGAKLIFKARIPGKDHKKTGLGAEGKGAVEFYDQRRFFTITGNRLPGTPLDVAQRQAELDGIYHELFPEKSKPEKVASTSPPLVVQPGDVLTLEDTDILAMACEAQGGGKFRSLYFDGDLTAYHGDHSRADQALASKLAYWCGPDSEEQIDRLFRQSALYRDKWDRDDYRHRTIGKALDREPHEFHAVALVEFTHLEEQALQIVGSWQKEPEWAGLVERAVQRTTRKTTNGDTPVPSVSRGRRGFLIPELDSLPRRRGTSIVIFRTTVS
jgi:putative DNA primase/helicase